MTRLIGYRLPVHGLPVVQVTHAIRHHDDALPSAVLTRAGEQAGTPFVDPDFAMVTPLDRSHEVRASKMLPWAWILL